MREARKRQARMFFSLEKCEHGKSKKKPREVRKEATVSSNLVSKTGVSKKKHYKPDPMLGT